MTMKLRNCLVVALVAAGSCLVQTAPAQAAETIKLVAIDGYPARSMWVK